MPEIVLPVMNDEENEKIIEAVEAIGRCMNTDITVEKVFTIKISWPNAAGNVGIILNDLVGIKTRKKYKQGKSVSLNPKSAEEYINSKNL